MPTPLTSCAIFCRVIDNFGDAGVCWRLACQLADEYGWQVTLVIDQPECLARLAPDHARWPVRVVPWTLDAHLSSVADIVIEAFACTLPKPYLEAMRRRQQAPVWLNLEYLSAEAWIDGCHGLPSPQADGLRKHFYFPGFTPASGGLLREADYATRRATFERAEFCSEFGIPDIAGEILISYFAYDHAPKAQLLSALATAATPVRLLRPGADTHFRQGALTVQPLPFLPQRRYDELLWLCDLNFVRGEDSFVRAQWAAKPLLWHIYRQPEDAHLDKLNAFLDRYLAAQVGAGETAIFRSAMLAWNTGTAIDWRGFLTRLPDYTQRAQHWRDRLWQQPDLARQLVEFCGNLRLRLE